MPAATPTPTLRVATYNVHGCIGTDRQRSESRIAEVIASLSVDVVALQEVDLGRARSAQADQAELIATQLGWTHVFHPAMRHGDEQYGNAFLSLLPFTLKRTAELPGLAPWYCRETRGALWLEIETELGLVQIVNTHFGLSGAERRLQAELLTSSEWLGGIPANAPAILLGDFNSPRASRTYRFLARQLGDVRTQVQPRRTFRTFPTRLPAVAVDHIFVNPALQATRVDVYRTPVSRVASDHFPLAAELHLAE